MDSPLLSIIIPVYNLEDYVIGCLDSIYSQRVDEHLFEVVAIDDGSTDGSLKNLQQYASRHGNMQAIGQDNGGVSSARNHGMDICRGKFITFLDADDTLFAGSIQEVIDNILSHKDSLDILYARVFKKLPDNHLQEVHSWQGLFAEGRIHHAASLQQSGYINGGSVCGGVYRKSFFEQHQLRFAEGVANGEDTIFTHLMYACSPRILFKDIRLYAVHVRQGSATHDCTMQRVCKIENNILYLIHQRKLHSSNPSLTEAINQATYHSIMLAIEMYLDVSGHKDYHKLCHTLHLHEIRPLKTSPSAPLHQRVKLALFNTNFRLCLLLIACERKKNALMQQLRKS